MPRFSSPAAFLTLVLLLGQHVLLAQANDGFQRRDGTMYLVRNGEIKPMPRDIRLPNGRLVTRDGFVVQRDGRRTELHDGEGCTMLGEATTLSRAGNGRLQLAGPAPAVPTNGRVVVVPAQSWSAWFRGRGKGKHKGWKKHRD
ncbi:DUF6799 domain-containing protein [Hymenobacter metallilatus]|uniref:DUF6799 domain-containing protein n=1 Tax=Hymenobacter metallilatus TaxID=2493666 RepID=A0A3R9MCW7_9BACT|nr:DUF6799 domain-containing protein [Hymenobacter metallilatus]RSK37338.1 hypothetical protein EI290_01405 [Hymenobacter metallilatus]